MRRPTHTLLVTLLTLSGAAASADDASPEQWVNKVGGDVIRERGRITIVWLNDTKATDDGLVHLKSLKWLEELDLTNTQISNTGLAHVRELKSLRKLMLWDTKITDEGLAHLKSLKSLELLELSYTKITDAGLAVHGFR